MNKLIVSPDLLNRMVSHCRSGYPNEVCGILAGRGGLTKKIYEMPSIEKSPVSYMMEPKKQFEVMKEMRNEGPTMLAIYHSNPQSQAYPSAKDIDLAFYDDAVYIIVSLIEYDRPEIRAFKINDGNVMEVLIVPR